MNSFPDLLRRWRQQRRYSQLQLATDAGVSSRHISFLETGRSRPSRDMILHLGEVLTVPFDVRNRMLTAAGFAARFPGRSFEDAAMEPILRAIDWTLDRHAPYPGIAIDGGWVIRRMNAPAERLFGGFGADVGVSMIDLLMREELQELIENWPEVAALSAQRLRSESTTRGGVSALDEAVDYFATFGGSEERDAPVVPTVFRFGDQRLSLFGTLAQFTTTTDQTVEELRVELFFPADPEAKALLEALAVEE